MAKDKKSEALDIALGEIEKRFGQGAVMRLGEASADMQVEAIPTGSLALDLALGIGGIPRSRVTELFGPEMAGKTSLALHVVAQAQALGGPAASIRFEHAPAPAFASAGGRRKHRAGGVGRDSNSPDWKILPVMWRRRAPAARRG